MQKRHGASWQTELDFGFPDILQHKIDFKKLGYNKLCLTEVLNADLSIASYGKDVYRLGCVDVLQRVQIALKQHGLDESIFLYSYGYKNFALLCNDNIGAQEFLALMHSFYQEFEYAQSAQVEVSGVSRFVVVLQPDHMLERALNTLSFNKETQENFLISDQSSFSVSKLDEEMQIFEMLNRAIKEKWVVPYYQGIRNNQTGEIDKYEALMRIVDNNGVVHAPGTFLEIAKKYKVYNKLSQIMIDRAMFEFQNRPEELSINLSLYDIRTPSFKSWFAECLQAHPHPQRLTIEFVETEDYKKDDSLFDFVELLRKSACKISVDDFGTGYATFTAIMALRPDYIKVDGQIIRDICCKEENLIILQSICYMSELIQSQVIAEYVENLDIHEALLREKVPFSQGFYFSKPQPSSELPKV